MQKIVVVGGGLVGLAVALKVSRRLPHARVTVLEKEQGPGLHQSGRNSGVLHAGLYYKPGSLKARLAVSGIQEMVRFCEQRNIAHETCGKLVVATDEAELQRLHDLHARGQANGLAGLRMLTRDEMLEIEPHVGGIAALRVPQEGIVDYQAVCSALCNEIQSCGGSIVFNTKVNRLQLKGAEWQISTNRDQFTADYLVNCAGLHCDRISQLAGEPRSARIIPFRGEYFKIKPERQHLVRNLIYPVPDPQFPFLGVHFTRLIQGGIEAGPNAVLAFAREGYARTTIRLPDLWDALTFPGLWRFLGRHRRMSWEEMRRSLSKALFCKSLQKLVPTIQPDDLMPGGTGVRAQAMSLDGNLVQDFLVLSRPRALHVLNAPSPAATASLAIGGEIASQVPGSN